MYYGDASRLYFVTLHLDGLLLRLSDGKRRENRRKMFQENQHTLQTRDSGFDVLKIAAAFFVICLHSGMTDNYGGIVLKSLARLAVPSFFLITGYYYPKMVEKQHFGQHFKKILKLTALAFVLNIPFALAECQYRFGHVAHFFDIFTVDNFFHLLQAHPDALFFHLWYFIVLIYALALLRLFDKIHLLHGFCLVAPLFLLVSFTDRLDWVDWPLPAHHLWYSALPYVCTGCLFRLQQEKTDSIPFSRKRTTLSMLLLLSGLLIFEIVGHWTAGKYSIAGELMAIPLFIMALKFPHFGSGSLWAFCGHHCATYIYILHPIFIFCINRWRENVFNFSTLLIPFIGFSMTCGMVLLGIEFSQQRKRRH